MQIQKVNFNNSNFSSFFGNKKQKISFSQSKNMTSLIVRPPAELALLTQKEDEYFLRFLNKNGKVTKKEYEEIIKKHPRTLVLAKKKCEEISKTMSCNPQITAKIAFELKKHYDEYYKNYTILSVGTSPSPITEVMSNLGANVIFLPISGLRELEQNMHYFNRINYPTLASKHPNLETIMDYCTKKGIAKNDAGSILILDFCATGKSARLVKQMLFERDDIPKENIFIHDVTKTLEYIKNECNSRITQEEIGYLDADMRTSRCAKISNIPHFYYDNTGYNSHKTIVRKPLESKWNLFNRFEEFSKPDARAWALVATAEAFKLQNNIS